MLLDHLGLILLERVGVLSFRKTRHGCLKAELLVVPELAPDVQNFLIVCVV